MIYREGFSKAIKAINKQTVNKPGDRAIKAHAVGDSVTRRTELSPQNPIKTAGISEVVGRLILSPFAGCQKDTKMI
jgi:hypothetical protein